MLLSQEAKPQRCAAQFVAQALRQRVWPLAHGLTGDAEQPAEGAVAPGAVLTLMQPGYELLGRLVRPANVVVAAKTASPGPAPSGGAYGAGGDEPAPGGGSVDTRA